MEVFFSEEQVAVLTHAPTAGPRVLPLPSLLDSPVVALLHLLLREQPHRPVELDASSLKRICPLAALLLTCILRERSRNGASVRIVNINYEVRRTLDQHPLLQFSSEIRSSPEVTGTCDT